VKENAVDDFEAALADAVYAQTDIEFGGIDDLPFEVAGSVNQRRAFRRYDWASLLAFVADLAQQLYARRLTINEINRVVDVALRVHIAPADFDGFPVLELVACDELSGHVEIQKFSHEATRRRHEGKKGIFRQDLQDFQDENFGWIEQKHIEINPAQSCKSCLNVFFVLRGRDQNPNCCSCVSRSLNF
jgi:hypothetical protein